MLLKLLLIVHLFVDFYINNIHYGKDGYSCKKDSEGIEENLEKEKKVSWQSDHPEMHLIIRNSVYVFLPLVLVHFFYTPDNWVDTSVVVILLMIHGLIDLAEMRFGGKFRRSYVLFFKQLMHLTLILVVYAYIARNYNSSINLADYGYFINVLLTILILSKTANVIFRTYFDTFKPQEDITNTEIGYKNAGSLIGVMERWLVMIFLLSGNYIAVGFVITAKSIARYEKLAKTQFGEYFLLGTLYSVLYTMVVYHLIFVFFS